MADDLSKEYDRNRDKTENTESSVNKRITIAGGFLDFALFVADVEHLKFILDTGEEDIKHYKLLLSLLIISLSFQIFVGILLFMGGFGDNSRQTHDQAKWTRILNHITVALVALIAILNVFITTFGDRGETVYRFRTRHNCDFNSISLNYNQSIT